MAAPTNKGPISDEERRQLAAKLDEELTGFVENLPRTPYKDGFRKETMDEEMEEHPAFRTAPIQEGEDLPPLVAAMQALKYDPEENSPDELANSYKEDGNHNFKLKKYQWAIASYTEAIKQKSSNVELNAQLYTNRATAHYYLGNLRSCLQDCKVAIKMKPDHMKAIIKSAQSCLRLREYVESINFCEMGLKINCEEKTLLQVRDKAECEQKVALRDERKNMAANRKKTELEKKLLAALLVRKIQLAKDPDVELNVCDLEPQHPMAIGSRVYLDPNGSLHWPVLYLYPEDGEQDCVQDVSEDATFGDQLRTIFGKEIREPLKEDSATKKSLLKVYFENQHSNTIHEVKKSCSLKSILSDERYVVFNGLPVFQLLYDNSEFTRDYLSRYSK